ncbi:hypothetical protein KIPB_002940, partial [Kipferlia bialata]|eukprot:g2940.t1
MTLPHQTVACTLTPSHASYVGCRVPGVESDVESDVEVVHLQ